MIWRLQKYLAHCGIASRRKCEDLIASGAVRVNGKVITTLGAKVDTKEDRVTVSGRLVRPSSKKTYIMLNKPSGYIVSRSDELGRKTVFNLLPSSSKDLFPIGRLDLNSEGLLLLTNDGELAYRLSHPKFNVEKEYIVTVRGIPTKRALERLKKGIVISGKLSAPARVRMIEANKSQSTLSVSVREGRKRLVRLMLGAVGYPVERLIRVGIGPLRLGKLPSGEFRNLSSDELSSLQKAAGLIK